MCDKDPGCFAFHWNNDLKACGFWHASDGVKGNGKKDAWTCRIKKSTAGNKAFTMIHKGNYCLGFKKTI